MSNKTVVFLFCCPIKVLDSPQRPLGDQYADFKQYKKSGAPPPLPDAPIISRMTDRNLLLSWKPSVPLTARYPVTYQVIPKTL